MSLLLYMDVHVPRAITRTLAAAGVDVVTAQEDGGARLADPDLLDRAEDEKRKAEMGKLKYKVRASASL